jgi:hypothetical protein
MLVGGSAQTRYMGPTYFTKLLFFTGYSDPAAEVHPLILDKRVATAPRDQGLFATRARNADWPNDIYRPYLAYCHEQTPPTPWRCKPICSTRVVRPTDGPLNCHRSQQHS